MMNKPKLCNLDCDDYVIDWAQEANGIIQDIRSHVKESYVSTKLLTTATESYFNLTTLGGKRLCVKVYSEGLHIVGADYDVKDKENSEECHYETPYALLSDVCPLYVNSFGNALVDALNKLGNEFK